MFWTPRYPDLTPLVLYGLLFLDISSKLLGIKERIMKKIAPIDKNSYRKQCIMYFSGYTNVQVAKKLA
jgi:hypothetical protein